MFLFWKILESFCHFKILHDIFIVEYCILFPIPNFLEEYLFGITERILILEKFLLFIYLQSATFFKNAKYFISFTDELKNSNFRIIPSSISISYRLILSRKSKK